MSQRPSGGREDVEEPELFLTRGGGVADGMVKPAGELEAEVTVDTGADEDRQLRRGRAGSLRRRSRPELGLDQIGAVGMRLDIEQAALQSVAARNLNRARHGPSRDLVPIGRPADLDP